MLGFGEGAVDPFPLLFLFSVFSSSNDFPAWNYLSLTMWSSSNFLVCVCCAHLSLFFPGKKYSKATAFVEM